MTQHDHRELVPGCFRCDLGRDEEAALAFEVRNRATDPLRIIDAAGEPLVTISADGNVTIHNGAAVNEAARIFWAAVQQEIRGF